MTYFIDCGMVAHRIPKTIFVPTFRIIKPRSVQISDMKKLSDMPPVDTVDFNFLCNEDGDSFYTHNTSIRRYFQHFNGQQHGKPIKAHVDIRGICIKILNGYEAGFRNLWKEISYQNDSYKSDAMKEMFKVIAFEIENQLKA